MTAPRSASIIAGSVLFLLATVTGCSTSGDPTAPAEAAETPTQSASFPPPGVGLRETCPEVERAIKPIDPVLSTPSEIEAARLDVQTLHDAGDTETQNALDGLLASLELSRDATQGQSAVEAMGAFINALSNLADRCEAVGSSALQ